MKTAWINLRHLHDDRALAFKAGLSRLGYRIAHGVTFEPGGEDILVTWNRIMAGEQSAQAFERIGRPVLVAENASWGNDFLGRRWLTLCRSQHNVAHGYLRAGRWSRWDALGVELSPWRSHGETVILPQRGIGSNPMPRNWASKQEGRIRRHPGSQEFLSLKDDLFKASAVVTWGSGAAIKALMWGCKVESHMPRWIGEQNNTDAERLAMFRRLAWAQWEIREFESGDAFDWVLTC